MPRVATKYNCPHCETVCTRQRDYEVHLRTHTNEKPFECEQCGMAFSADYTLIRHIRQVHEQERDHQCQICDESFFTRTHLKRHMLTHSKILNFTCTLCQESFSRKDTLDLHILNKHTEERKFACDQTDCNFKTNQSSALTKHIRTKHGTTSETNT